MTNDIELKERQIAEEIFREVKNGKLAESKIDEEIEIRTKKIDIYQEEWQKGYMSQRIREEIISLLEKEKNQAAIVKETEENQKAISRMRKLNPEEKKRVRLASLFLKIILCINAFILLGPVLLGKQHFQLFIPAFSLFYNISIPAIIIICLILSVDLYKKWYIVLPVLVIISPFISGWMGIGGWFFGVFLCISILVDAHKRIKISSDKA